MKLHCSPISPYARKVMILARLHGIPLEEIPATPDPVKGYTGGDNPLGKIPALEWQPGQWLFDSPVICEYLDTLGKSPVLPADAHMHFIQKWQHALGDGISDATYNLRYEMVRPEELHWPQMIARHEAALNAAVDTLETISAWLGEDWTYGNLAIVCGLDYMNFRAGHLNWKTRAPKLAAWHKDFESAPFYVETYAYS